MDKQYKGFNQSPIGLIEVIGTADAITSVNFNENRAEEESCPLITDCINQLDEYFKGVRKTFDLSILASGTEFQKKVWLSLKTIPFGQTLTYQEIATFIMQDKAVRAVGNANKKNPLYIIIPCHRVIGKNGNLTGYGGGLWRKAWLIKHEAAFSGSQSDQR